MNLKKTRSKKIPKCVFLVTNKQKMIFATKKLKIKYGPLYKILKNINLFN